MNITDFVANYASVTPADIRRFVTAVTEALEAYTEKTEEETQFLRTLEREPPNTGPK